jgi:hypothetical protein
MSKPLATIETNKVVEQFIRMMVQESADPYQVLVGIHNAFSRGGVFYEGPNMNWTDFGIGDEWLLKLFEGFETSMNAMKEIEKNNT